MVLRRAVTSAPVSEPTLMTDSSSVKVASSPPNVRVANSGSTTWKLNASVPMIAIITSGIQRSGTVRT